MMPTVYEIERGHVSDIYEEVDQGYRSVSFDVVVPLDYIQKHAQGLVWGSEPQSDVPIPPPRFNNLKEVGKHLFELDKGRNGTWIVRNVPIYKTHGDTRGRGHISDHTFLSRIVKNFYQVKQSTAELFGDQSVAWLPKWHYGHTPLNPDWPEQSCAGKIDNLYIVEDFLFGDIVDLDKQAAERLVKGEFPDRSAEIDIKRARLLSVAALGFRTPHFGLPQMNSEKLREQYKSLVEKHSFGDVVENHVFLNEDLVMTTEKKKLTEKEVARFFLALEHNESLKEKFEAEKDKLIQKHIGLAGSEPSGPDLQSILLNVIQSLMSQKMNTDSNNPYQMNASDVLDFESTEHHAGGDQGFEEEGTGAAGKDDTGIRKGKKEGDSDTDSQGSPSESSEGGSGNDEFIDFKGDAVEKNLLQTAERIKHAFLHGNREQKEAASREVVSHLTSMSSIIANQGKALQNLSEHHAKERLARRKESFRHKLTELFSNGYAAVSNKDAVERHLGILLTLPDKQAAEYLEVLESSPKVTSPRPVRRDEIMTHGMDNEDRLRSAYNSDEFKHLRKFGVDFDQFKILNRFSDIQESL